MANKPSSKKKTTKTAADSSVKGGGIMSLNKSKTTPFMKAIIILIIISMVTLFLYGGFAGFAELFRSQSQTNVNAATDPVKAIQAKYDSQVSAFSSALKSYPTSATLIVSLANVHENYAFDLMKEANKTSTPATATMELLQKEWSAALANFKKAAKIQKPAKDTSVDYAIASYYSGETTAAIKLARGALAQDPNFAPAYYNLGIFYETANNTALAIDSYTKYLALDPTGQFGNREFATTQLQSLQKSGTVGQPSTNTTP